MNINNPNFTELGYIEADWQQYIDLPEINFNDSTFYIEEIVQTANPKNYISFWGNSEGSTSVEAWSNENQRGQFRYKGRTLQYDFAVPKDAVHIYGFEKDTDGNYNVYFDNKTGEPEKIRTGTSEPVSDDLHLRLFNNGKSNSYFQGKIYRVYIEYNGQQKYDLYPAKRIADNEAGLYDILTNTFYPSNSAVEFIAGPDKEEITVTVTTQGTGTVSLPVSTLSYEFITIESTPGENFVFGGYYNLNSQLVTLERKLIFFSNSEDIEFTAKFTDTTNPVTTLTRTFSLYRSTGNTRTRQPDDVFDTTISVTIPKVLKSFYDKQGSDYGNQGTEVYGYYVTNIINNLVFDDYVEDYENLYSLTNLNNIRNFFEAGQDLITNTSDHGYNIRLVDEISGYYVTITLCSDSDWGQGFFYDNDDNLIYNCRSLFSRDRSSNPTTYSSLAFNGFEDGQVTENSAIVLIRAANQGTQKSVLIQSDEDGNVQGSKDLLNWFIGVKRGEIVPPEDPYDKLGNSAQGGGNGLFNFVFDFTEIEELPERISAVSSGFVALYQIPNSSVMQDIAEFLWSSSFFDNIRKFIERPEDSIISLHILPVELSGTEISNEQITAAGVHFYKAWTQSEDPIKADRVLNQYYVYDLGFITVPEIWGSALDYQPYTSAEIYLPYIGYCKLDIDEIQGSTLGLVYGIDLLSGDCMAFISINGNLKYQFAGNCASKIPYSSKTEEYLPALIGTILGIGAGAATGGASIGAVGALTAGAISVLKQDIKKGSSVGGTRGFLSLQKPVLYLKRPNQNVPAGYNHFKGLPSNITAFLGDLKGFTKVDSIHLENINATESEKQEIEELLKEGVII